MCRWWISAQATIYFGVSKQRPDLLSELNRAQREIQRNEFDYNGALTRKYHSQTTSAISLSESESDWLAARGNVLHLGLLDDKQEARSTSMNKIFSPVGLRRTIGMDLTRNIKKIG